MDYYKQTKNMRDNIEKIIKASMPKGVLIDTLEYHIMKQYGVTQKPINKWLDTLYQHNEIEFIANTMVKWKEPKKKRWKKKQR